LVKESHASPRRKIPMSKEEKRKYGKCQAQASLRIEGVENSGLAQNLKNPFRRGANQNFRDYQDSFSPATKRREKNKNY